MNNRIIWEVDLEVYGDVSVNKAISIKSRKGFDLDQFYSTVKIINNESGFKAMVTAYAPNNKLAHEAALVYFGKMLDVLSFIIDTPLELSFFGNANRTIPASNVRRILNKSDFEKAFNIARTLEYGHLDEMRDLINRGELEDRQSHPALLNSLSWYLKGNIAINPLDKFVSYWTALEILGTKYFTPTDKTSGEGRIKNKIYQCFIDHFGPIETWELSDRWIDNTYEHRNRLVHGGIPMNIESIIETEKIMEETKDQCKNLIRRVIQELDMDFSI